MIVSAPTSSGKTVLFELLIAKLMNEKKTKCLYLAPIKSLCHEKCHSWRKKFMASMNVMELTGDTL
jgi:ATP-dependent DNA helicase HFM1/MER3